MSKLAKYTVVLAAVLGIAFATRELLVKLQNKFNSFQAGEHKAKITVSDKIITAEIADTSQKRELGLQGHKTLSNLEGMLFVFERPVFATIWMKNMLIPLDIIWLGEDMKIVHIVNNAAPCTNVAETCPIYTTPEIAKYVLEVNSGFAEKNGLKDGGTIPIQL